STTRKNVVFGEGNIDARLLLIGEAPGEDEDKSGKPFVGRSGKLLNNMIEACHLKREDLYIINVLRCRPPNNRLPKSTEILNCSAFIKRTIALVNPEFILCLGSVASHTLTGLNIKDARGKWFYYNHHRVTATYHPSYLIRCTQYKPDAWSDLKMLIDAMQKNQSPPLPDKIS